MSATNCEFKFTKNEDGNDSYPYSGNITLGFLTVSVQPSIETINGNDIPDIQLKLMSIITGANGSVIFNDVDCENSVTVKDDIFIMRWGTAFDVIGNAEFKCTYSDNRTEINKFLTYLHDEYDKIYKKGFVNTIPHDKIYYW